MNIVGGNSFLRNLRNLEYFQMDLGTTKRNVKTGKFKKLSEFELKYANLFENPLLKYGNIGSATFYEDRYLTDNHYFIFKDEDVYQIEYTLDELYDFGDYILTSMRKIDEAENEEKENVESLKEYKENGGTTWTSDDLKNGKKPYMIDQTLSRDEYRKQLADKKGRK